MPDEMITAAKKKVMAFECDSCGEAFESWERLRQHHVDCQPDSFDGDAE